MRNPINKNNCTEIGYVKKTHGISGDLLINFEEGFETIFDDAEFLFFEIDGLPVPFFMEEIELRDNNAAAVKFSFIETKEKAQYYVGSKVLVDNILVLPDENTFHFMMLKGFTLFDSTRGKLGSIREIDDYSGNIVLTVDYQKEEILLPLNEDLIMAFDQKKRTIEMDFPQGLFDLSE